VKLLLDQNLSYKLVDRLADVFPGSTQVRLLGFARYSDSELWYYARTHGFVFVTKDEDIPELALLRGSPPKVVWVRIGNSTTQAVERLLRANVDVIRAFLDDPERTVLERDRLITRSRSRARRRSSPARW
jgi:predicted nuclease of predicted toxin-antitoxin system